jgi:Xaa-Pro aminopeptidase
MREHYPRFSDAEVKRRYDLVYGMMDEQGLDCLVLYGDSTLGNLHQLNCHWLSNYLDEQYCYVVLPRNGSPVLFVSIPADAPAAMAVSPIEDVRGGGVGVQMGPAVARTLKEMAGAAGRVGTVANFAISGGLPHSHHEAFVEALPNAELVDVARSYEDLRVVPSDEEMEWFGKGVALTDLAWERLVDAIEPGRTEAELLGAVHSAYMLEGGSYCFAILGATPMREPLMAYPHGIPNQGALRPVADGDLVICEMSASYYGYAGQCFCSVAVGEPSDAVAEAAQFTGELYDDLCQVVRAGNTDKEVAEVTNRVLERGWDCEAPFIHAWGTHFGHPTLGFESWTPWPVEFREGELIVIEPNPCTPDALTGLQLGNLTQVGADAATALHKRGREFVVKT